MPSKPNLNLLSGEESFRLLVENVKDYAIFMLDPGGQITTWNAGAKRIKGYDASEIIGSHFSRFYTVEDIDRKHPQEELLIAIRDGRFEEEGWRVKKDGSKFWANVVITRLDDSHGKHVGFAKITRDLTERRAAEMAAEEERRKTAILEQVKKAVENERENFRNLFKQTPEMVCILKGPNHVFEFVNEAHIKTLGFDATGLTVRVAQPESVEVHGILDEVYQTGQTAELHEIAVTVADRRRYFNLTYAARKDYDGVINGIMILGVEVTEQLEAAKVLARAVRTRDEFMSIASHELKTPLTVLSLQSQLRNRDISHGELQRFTADKLPQLIAEDEKQINRLIRLVDEMLDVTRIQSGKLELNAEKFDLCEMVRDALERTSAQIESNGVSIELSAESTLVGRWDRFRLEQVVINLLTNALKYGAGKPVQIRTTGDSTHARIEVKDHGIGIAKDDQARIFDQFERAVPVNSTAGLGLGLFISRQIVEAHGGAIWVESELGEGATFIVELPSDQRVHRLGVTAAPP